MNDFDIEEIKARVAKGFNLLSRAQRDMVDIFTLHMDSDWDCVLGQIFGRYAYGMDELFPGTDPVGEDYEKRDRAGTEYGFFQTYAEPHAFERYEEIQREWIRLLCEERALS